MERDERDAERAAVNPAARRDRPGEPHHDLVERKGRAEPHPKPFQDEPPDPRDQGGIGS